MNRRGTDRWAAGFAAGLCVAALVMTGCDDVNKDSYKPSSLDETARAAEVLAGLPSLEETEPTITAAIEKIAAGASAVDPRLQWTWQNGRSQAGCAPPFEQTAGQLVYVADYVSNSAPIQDQDWPRIYELARATASSIGATQVEVLEDEPGHHVVRLYNETGTAIRLGTKVAASLAGETGCRLPAAKKN